MDPTGKGLALAILPSLKVLDHLAGWTQVTLDLQNKTLYKCTNVGYLLLCFTLNVF